MNGRACAVRECPLPATGDLTLWRQGHRNPLVLRLCMVHYNAVFDALTQIVEGGQTVLTPEGEETLAP